MEKYVIVFGRAKDHTDSEVTYFVRASKRTDNVSVMTGISLVTMKHSVKIVHKIS